MQTDWVLFLQQLGAQWESDRVAHFGDRAQELALRDSDVLVSLDPLGILRANGPDARKFLLAQFTNDVQRVTPETAQLNGYCSAKGRLLALMWVIQLGDDFLLVLPRTILEATLKRLRMFVLNAKVTLEDVSNQWIALGCAGPHAAAAIERVAGHAPNAVCGVVSTSNNVVVRLPATIPRYLVLAGRNPAESVQSLWHELAQTLRPVATDVWTALEVLSGLPQVESTTVDEFVPQMVNLERVEGLSFTKGCYPGQEIVARAQYRGQVKRRMLLLRGAGETCPRAGEKIFADNHSENSVGRVVQAAPASLNEFFLLAVIENDKRDLPLHLENSIHSRLELMELPYAVDTN